MQPTASADGVPDRLWDAALWDLLRDFLARSGKGVRAHLVTAGWRLGGRSATTIPAALPLLVELIHAGSLLVDDVEDGAETRRGAPAAHRIFGEPLAINAGGWLYFAPFVLLQRIPVSGAARLELYDRMSRVMLQCHEGQALDLATRVVDVAADEIGAVVDTVTRLKTASLMRLSIGMGAIAAGATPWDVTALERFGERAGVALQMYDDLSGLVRDELAHKADEDLAGACPTWPWAWLAEVAGPQTYAAMTAELDGCATDAPRRAALRRRLADHVSEHGRACARDTLDAACDALTTALGPSPALTELCAAVRTLEAAYVQP